MKKSTLALSMAVIFSATMPTLSAADNHQAKPGKAFFKKLDHASFMPNLMKHIKQNQANLKISAQQMAELDKFHQANSPQVRGMVEKVIELEAQAKKLALQNYPPEQVAEIGNQSIQLRHDIMMAKLKCRTFVKSVLSDEQYKQAMTSYK